MIQPGVPPLDHSRMVIAAYRQHEQLLGCGCPPDPPKVNASVTFQPSNAVQPGQQRYSPQSGATITGPNLYYGPGLTCVRAGCYSLQATIKLSRALTQGAGGLGVIVVTGIPVLSVPMTDQGGVATANVTGLLNLTANQSINVGYENTSSQVQDVQVTTLSVSEVWVP